MSSNIRNISFILLYISIWLSLDSSIYNLLNLGAPNIVKPGASDIVKLNTSLFFEFLISLRFVFPYIIFVILIFLFRKDLFLVKLEGLFKYIVYLLIISFSLQSIILFFNENNIFNITFSLISIILIINLIYFFNYFDLKNIFLIGLMILFFITVIYGSVLIHHLIFYSENLNLYGSWPDSMEALQFLSNEVPRSSGISRSSFILMIPLGFYILVNKEFNFKIYIIYLFFCFLMLTTQSRITFLAYVFGFITFIYYIFFKPENNNLKNKLKKLFIVLIFPIIVWLICLELLSMSRTAPAYIEYFSDQFKLTYRSYNSDNSGNFDNLDAEFEKKYERLIRKSNKQSFTSNRIYDWKNIIENNKNYIFGYGALGDRHLINQTASSLHFYNYASGGLLSVLIFLILIFRTIFICFMLIFKFNTKPDKNNYLVLSSCFIVMFLIIRSFVESSFAVYGIDSIIFFSSYIFIEQFYKKNKVY